MRINHRVSIAVHIEMGPPARPVVLLNQFERHRIQIRTEFNPPVNAWLEYLMLVRAGPHGWLKNAEVNPHG